MRALVGGIVLAQARVAALWWRRAGGAMSWGDMCVLALLSCPRSTRSPTCGPRSCSRAPGGPRLALRAGQFAIPAVGLLIGFIAVAEKLREFEDELTANLWPSASAPGRTRSA